LKVQKEIFAPTLPFDTDIYQRLTRFNRLGDPTLLGISLTSGDLSILSFPSLETVYSMKAEGDVLSMDFSPAANDTVRFPDYGSLI
jgi:hypothetical protein